jgi:hypothetical protein
VVAVVDVMFLAGLLAREEVVEVVLEVWLILTGQQALQTQAAEVVVQYLTPEVVQAALAS